MRAPGTVLGIPGKAVRGNWDGEQTGLSQGLGVRGPRLWKQLRHVFRGVLCPEVELVCSMRKQWDTAPGD